MACLEITNTNTYQANMNIGDKIEKATWYVNNVYPNIVIVSYIWIKWYTMRNFK